MSTPGICWKMTGDGAPRQLAANEAIRIGTLLAPWPTLLQYLQRQALCDAGFFLEYRTAETGPHGWSVPVIGQDAEGRCAAVRAPLPAPAPPPPDPEALETALANLAARINAEFTRRAEQVVGPSSEWIYRIGRMSALTAATGAGTATEAEGAELAALLAQAAHVQALRQYGWIPSAPEMWGPAPADLSTSLYGWAVAKGLDATAVAAISAANPPVTAPQWPGVAP